MSSLSCTNTAMDLRKCCEFEYILIGDLRDLLEDAPSEENRRWTAAVLDSLLETLPREFELKSQDGYLSEVLDEFPSWDTVVERLRQQHVALHRRLTQLRIRLMANERLQEVAEQLRLDLETWIDAFTELHQAERQITMTAMNLEVGAGD